ncbi:WW domain containing protein [Histomonas meleagridis]|uniref:WW domain containing protein n=1 Tax=Histomonas meleagridis TaxID=135588 RepID=UPI0035598627|nr:WW domain containing protein [Histomonas meleagridis]KAH0804842.1 WW domain containing protein [Histomonas meleagridis]
MSSRRKEKWEEVLSSDGRIYYYNPKTGVSQWENPEDKKLPSSYFWRKCKDSEGNPFYYNARTKESTWKRPSDYTSEIEKHQEIQYKRQNFFKMMSSSVPKSLNPISHPTPALHTLKETSVRFDTDPRLIDTTPNQRERFIDEWLVLERKRRVDLEKKLVENAKERLKEKMYDLVQSGKFTTETTWDDIITYFKHNTDWRILLNYDRFQVFTEVKKAVHDEYVLTFNEDREQRLKVEAVRRIKFQRAAFPIVSSYQIPFTSLTYKTVIDQISQLPEYREMQLNITGSTAIDLIYDMVEERHKELDEKASSLSFSDEDCDFEYFIKHFKNELNGINEDSIQYIYEIAKKNYLIEKELHNKEAKTKHDLMMKLLKLTPALVKCTSFEAARDIVGKYHDFKEAGDEETQRQIFAEFVEWGKGRNCEPGEIIEGDDDWEDIGPMIENEIRKKQFAVQQK